MDEVIKSFTWVEQMKCAMQIMSDACNRNGSWTDCTKCPFDAYCDYILDATNIVPGEWKTDGSKEKND